MKHLFSIVLLAITVAMFSCSRDIAIPSISYTVEDVNAEAFQTTCVITCKNETIDGVSIQIRVLVAEDKSFSSAEQYEMQFVNGQWRCDISGLMHGTHYYYCFEIFSDIESYRLKDVYSFSTIVVTGLNVTTSEISNITQTTAKGGGSVTTDSTAIKERGICWSTSHNPTTSNSHAHNGTGEGSYTVNITGLNANTTYYVRAYAINNLGTTYGEEVSFTTLKIVTKPTVTTSQVTNITQTYATCGGNVTSDGDATVTERGVCWSTSNNPTTSNSHANSGTGTGSFTVHMTGLIANTTYFVRAYATNSVGTAYGEEVSFTTTSQQTNYIIGVSASPSSGGTVSGGGTYQQGQSCTVRAVANSGYSFVKWTENGSQVSTNANYTFTVSGNRSLVASFTLNSQNYSIILSANPTNGGTVSGEGTYQSGQTCTVRAVPYNGYSFSKWTENGSQVSTNANYTFTVSGNRALVAHFSYNGGGNAPTGAINGLFTINSSGGKVYFSQGNLQYQASTNTWRFANNQWDYVGGYNYGVHVGNVSGSSNSNISPTYNGWIDLFGWGTSGYHDSNDPYNTNYQPWSVSIDELSNTYNKYGYGPSTNMLSPNLTASSANYDWGIYNPISNGGNNINTWRTLTSEEWLYVFDKRSGCRYAYAQIETADGMILLPDGWNTNTYHLNNYNQSDANFSSNLISSSQWSVLENAGAVFLPAGGSRTGTSVNTLGGFGAYWSASYSNSYRASYVYFWDGYLYSQNNDYRKEGFSVRLVQDY